MPVNGDLTITVGHGALSQNGGNTSISGSGLTEVARGGTKASSYNGLPDSWGAGGFDAGYGGAASTAYGPGWLEEAAAATEGKITTAAIIMRQVNVWGIRHKWGASTTDDYGSPGGSSFNAGAPLVYSGNGQTPSGYGGGASGGFKACSGASGAGGLVILSWFE